MEPRTTCGYALAGSALATDSYEEELDRIVRAIFAERVKPPVGAPPAYAGIHPIAGLRSTDTAVLVAASEKALANDIQLESRSVLEKVDRVGITEYAFLESLEILEHQGHIEIVKTLASVDGMLAFSVTSWSRAQGSTSRNILTSILPPPTFDRAWGGEGPVRGLSAVVLVVALIVVPAASIGALGVIVEGEAGWDCETMGNQDCGSDADIGVVVEDAPGWDCLSMGSGSCGEDARSLAPPFHSGGANVSECGQVQGSCEMRADADPATGGFDIAAEAYGVSCTASEYGPCEEPQFGGTVSPGASAFASFNVVHVLEDPAESVTYRLTLDVNNATSVDANGDSIVYVRLSAQHLGCSPCRTETIIHPTSVRVGVPGPQTAELTLRNGLGACCDLPAGEIRLNVFADVRVETRAPYGYGSGSMEVGRTSIAGEVVPA